MVRHFAHTAVQGDLGVARAVGTGWWHKLLDGGNVKSRAQRMEGQRSVGPSGTVALELAGPEGQRRVVPASTVALELACSTSSCGEQKYANTPWRQTLPAMMQTQIPPAADPAAPPVDNPNEPPPCTPDGRPVQAGVPPRPPWRPPRRSAAAGTRRIPGPPPPPPPVRGTPAVAHEVGSFPAPSSLSSCPWAPPPTPTSPTSAMGDAASLVEDRLDHIRVILRLVLPASAITLARQHST